MQIITLLSDQVKTSDMCAKNSQQQHDFKEERKKRKEYVRVIFTIWPEGPVDYPQTKLRKSLQRLVVTSPTPSLAFSILSYRLPLMVGLRTGPNLLGLSVTSLYTKIPLLNLQAQRQSSNVSNYFVVSRYKRPKQKQSRANALSLWPKMKLMYRCIAQLVPLLCVVLMFISVLVVFEVLELVVIAIPVLFTV